MDLLHAKLEHSRGINAAVFVEVGLAKFAGRVDVPWGIQTSAFEVKFTLLPGNTLEHERSFIFFCRFQEEMLHC